MYVGGHVLSRVTAPLTTTIGRLALYLEILFQLNYYYYY